jgi:arylsulfatase A-like enzyme
VTADHGESLGEYGTFAHTNSVYEQLLHIPFLLIRYLNGEAQPGRAYPGLRSQTDIEPIILHELGMAVPATWSGLPLGERERRAFILFQMRPAFGLYDMRTPGKIWNTGTISARMRNSRSTSAPIRRKAIT